MTNSQIKYRYADCLKYGHLFGQKVYVMSNRMEMPRYTINGDLYAADSDMYVISIVDESKPQGRAGSRDSAYISFMEQDIDKVEMRDRPWIYLK
jgi:hypothetical protein